MSRNLDEAAFLFTSLSNYNREKAQALFHCLTEKLRMLGCRSFDVDVEFSPPPNDCWIVWVRVAEPEGAGPGWLEYIRERLSDLTFEGSDRLWVMGEPYTTRIMTDSRTKLAGCNRFWVIVYQDIPFLVSYDGKSHEADQDARYGLDYEYFELQRATRDHRQVHEQQVKVQELEATLRRTYTWERIDSRTGN
ncbi:hypothetical protein ASPSYDRAFT_34543 [Aspergillus sydowii CBS 593.65]|uniref:Uncharacterized protein n=1 Tax=Aspergillus sydowii CBS 593.65 TaxID=1036612 RepID=A0A1L9T886_9EURO|nr:uncharacterized protein ASPSYDRAFT_34543 [Aspergillus sydowii CBS 593.65]OJJ55636.1 hypothetical protein ASPSYDRAFT_34543 [Aspergillus sydowii CBS 593.65]